MVFLNRWKAILLCNLTESMNHLSLSNIKILEAMIQTFLKEIFSLLVSIPNHNSEPFLRLSHNKHRMI